MRSGRRTPAGRIAFEALSCGPALRRLLLAAATLWLDGGYVGMVEFNKTKRWKLCVF